MDDPGDTLVIRGAGRIYGLGDAGLGGATALVVRSGLVAYVGDDAGAEEWSAGARVVDLSALGLADTLVCPSFVDAHIHAVQAGQVLDGLDLHDVRSRTDLLDRLTRYATAHPGSRAIAGQGWDERSWPDPTPPTRAELDRAVGHPAAGGTAPAVYLARVDVHSAVVSSALLEAVPELAGDDGYRADGRLTRDAHHRARGAVAALFTDEERRGAARTALRRCAQRGVGAVHELGGPHLGPFADLQRVRDVGDELGIDVTTYWGAPADEATLALVDEHGLAGLAGDLCVDGAIGSRTAAVHEPYADDPDGGCGARYLSDEEILAHLVACTRAGRQAGFHCIGDDAVAAVVQGLRRTAEITGAAAVRAARHRLEHVEMIALDDLAVLAHLGVTASVQPAFDAWWGRSGELYEQRLGPDRSRRMNPFGSLRRAGVPLAFGSDAPVTPITGWGLVAGAVAHSRSDERLSIEDAFAAATRGGHAAGGSGDPNRGRLRLGQRAELAVWDTTGLERDASGLPRLEPQPPPADQAVGEPRCLLVQVGNRTAFLRPG